MCKISIIIPVLNQHHYTSQILKDIPKKIKSDYEIILIDDGSKELQDLPYTVIHKENKGVNYSWNEGVRLAQGEYLLIINNDIILGDGIDTKLIEGLQHNKIACPLSTYGANKRQLPKVIKEDNLCGWCFMLKKKDWLDIPEELKIWYGDNWIYEVLDRDVGWVDGLVHHFGSCTVNTENISDLLKQDIENREKIKTRATKNK